jgi:nitroreductase
MKKIIRYIKYITLFSILVLIINTSGTDVLTSENQQKIEYINKNKNVNFEYDVISLPNPYLPKSILEDTIAKRVSIREFKDKPISLKNISSILWSAYGIINKHRTIESLDGRQSVKIYVLMKEGVYLYNSSKHELQLYRHGDWRWIGQYDSAFIKLGLVWDKTKCTNQNIASAEIGMIGQNVYLMANSLFLGTVTTATDNYQLQLIGLPKTQKSLIIMPIGYPLIENNYSYKPIETEMPIPIINQLTFTEALENINKCAFIKGNLNESQISQIFWAGYGYSYLYDNVYHKRHRSVPSSHGIYPLEIFYANKDALYRYIPTDHSLKKFINISVISKICNASFPWISNSDVIIINLNLSKANNSWGWYYEAGAIWHNMLLEATSLNLSANVLINFDSNKLKSSLNLHGFEPLMLIQIGKKDDIDQIKPNVEIIYPEKGFLYVFGKKIMSSSKTVFLGKMIVDINVTDTSLLMVEYFINDKLVLEKYQKPFSITLPSFFIKQCILKIVANDYYNNYETKEISYLKIL